MNKEEQTRKLIERTLTEVDEKLDDLKASLIGAVVEITSNYNGQPYGRSQPSLKGKQFKIVGIHYSQSGGYWCPLSFRLENMRLFVRANEVKFV